MLICTNPFAGTVQGHIYIRLAGMEFFLEELNAALERGKDYILSSEGVFRLSREETDLTCHYDASKVADVPSGFRRGRFSLVGKDEADAIILSN